MCKCGSNVEGVAVDRCECGSCEVESEKERQIWWGTIVLVLSAMVLGSLSV